MRAVKSTSDRIFNFVNYAFFLVLSLVMVYPIWHQICLSISDPNRAKTGGFFLLPRGFDLTGYEVVLGSRYIWSAIFNSVFVTAASVVFSVLVCSALAYLLSKKQVPGSRFMMILVLFSFLFSGGMIPTYLVVNNTGLINSLWSLIIPTLFVPYNVIILRNFFQGLPPSVEESALIDGAGYIRIFFRIVLPLSKPVVATIAIWVAVSQWNDYMNPLLYIYNKDKYTLPLLVRNIVTGASEMASTYVQTVTNADIINAATIVIATAPILIIYPFLQKYFTQGIMLGAVKE